MRQKTFSIILFLVIWCSGALPVPSAVEGVFSALTQAAELPDPDTAKYLLKPGPYTVENLGSPVQAATMSSQITFRHPVTDEVHFIFLYYLMGLRATVPYQILDLNMDTGICRLADGGFGRPDPAPPVIYPGNGKVYIVGQSPGTLTVYDPLTGVAKQLHTLADVCAQSLTIGDDLAIYMGEATKGYLERYDPNLDPLETGAAESWTNYGIIDDPGAPYYRYVYSNGSDGRYVYMAIRDQNADALWRLVVKDMQTLQEQVFWTDKQATFINAYSSRRGYGVVGYSAPEVSMTYYRFDGFVQGAQVNQNNLPGTPIDVQWPQLSPSGYTHDESGMQPDSSNGGTVTVKWKKPGDTEWRQVAVPGVRLENVALRNMYSNGGPKLLGIPEAYTPSFSYDPSVDQAQILGRLVLSPYNALYSAIHHKWYVTGYPSAWAEYDPTQPWTLGSGWATDKNPRLMTQSPGGSGAKYFYYIAEDKDGFIYLGGHHERDSTGGSLHWYQPATDAAGYLRDPFVQIDPRGLADAMDGSKMVFSTAVCCGGTGDGKLFVFDTATKTIEREITPVPGKTETGAIIEVEPGVIMGGINSTLYKVDIRTGTVLAAQTAPGILFGSVLSHQRRFVQGPDGYLWAYIGDTSIYRIHPISLSMEKIVDASPAASITFHGNDMYITGRGQTFIRRIKGLFIPKVMLGDVDGNGDVNAYDAALVARYAVGYTDADFKDAAAADVDNIPGISAYDAALIAQRAVGLITKFPVEP